MAGTTINPYRFGGQLGYRRDGTNRQYVRERSLDTSRGRWLSRDPIGVDNSEVNSYFYANNNPTEFTDPSGLVPIGCNPQPIRPAPPGDPCNLPAPKIGDCTSKDLAAATLSCADIKQILTGCYVYARITVTLPSGLSEDIDQICRTCEKPPTDKYCCIGKCTARGDDPNICGHFFYSYICAGDLRSARQEACGFACAFATVGGKCHSGHCDQKNLKCYKKGREIK